MVHVVVCLIVTSCDWRACAPHGGGGGGDDSSNAFVGSFILVEVCK